MSDSHLFSPRRVAAVAVVAWFVVLLVGGAVLTLIASEPGNPLSPSRAAFLATNVTTLTGMRVTWATPGIVSAMASLAAASCVWAFMVAAFTRLAGDGVSRRTLVAAVVAPWLLCLLPLMATGNLVLASATATGSGFVRTAVPTTSATLWAILIPTTLAAIIGPLLIASASSWRALGVQRSVTFGGLALAALLAMVVAWGEPALAVDLRFAGVTDGAAELSSARRWSLVPVLLLGDAGGLKGATLLLLALEISGRAVSAFRTAAAWLVMLLSVWFLSYVGLLVTHPQASDDINAWLAASAAATASGSFTPPTLAGSEAWVLTASMLAGHLLPMAVLWWGVTRSSAVASAG